VWLYPRTGVAHSEAGEEATGLRTLSPATVARLPHYYQIFKTLHERGREYVSSERLGGLLGIAPSLVRKDLVEIAAGVQKVGYHIPSSLRSIQEILGINNTKKAFLVGAGSLGQALLAYQGFEDYGVRIVAAFDTDETKWERLIGRCKVLPVSELPGLVRRLHVKVGVLTVPADQAQATAVQMVNAGIRAIWNFAPIALTLPPDILVRQENLGVGLALLSYELEKQLNPYHGE
jgi:redox-sensing transcriptional repressor